MFGKQLLIGKETTNATMTCRKKRSEREILGDAYLT